MVLIILFLLIPVFCISQVVFYGTLVNFDIFNNLDALMLGISILISLFSCYFIFLLLTKAFNDSPFFLNRSERVNVYVSYVSFFMLGAFGLSLIINSLLKWSLANLTFGIICFLGVAYGIVNIFMKHRILTFTIESIDEEKELHLKCLTLYNKEVGPCEYYVYDNQEYLEDKTYECIYDDVSKSIIKIKN